MRKLLEITAPFILFCRRITFQLGRSCSNQSPPHNDMSSSPNAKSRSTNTLTLRVPFMFLLIATTLIFLLFPACSFVWWTAKGWFWRDTVIAGSIRTGGGQLLTVEQVRKLLDRFLQSNPHDEYLRMHIPRLQCTIMLAAPFIHSNMRTLAVGEHGHVPLALWQILGLHRWRVLDQFSASVYFDTQSLFFQRAPVMSQQCESIVSAARQEHAMERTSDLLSGLLTSRSNSLGSLRTEQSIPSAVSTNHPTDTELCVESVDLEKTSQEAGPFAPHSFELVFCLEVLEHLRDPRRMLQLVKAVLAPGGVFVLTTPNGGSLRNLLSALHKDRPGYEFHEREYFPNELRQLVESAGFSVRLHRTFSPYGDAPNQSVKSSYWKDWFRWDTQFAIWKGHMLAAGVDSEMSGTTQLMVLQHSLGASA